MGVNLQVPIEMIFVTINSLNSTISNFDSMQASIYTSGYDGTCVWEWELVCYNLDAVGRNVMLMNGGTSTNSTTIATMTIPGSTTILNRFRVPLAGPIGGPWLRLSQTTAAAALLVAASRIIVTQTNATKTVIYVPMTGHADTNNPSALRITDGSGSPIQYPQSYNVWHRDDSVYGDTTSVQIIANLGWQIGSSTFTVYCDLLNITNPGNAGSCATTGQTFYSTSKLYLEGITISPSGVSWTDLSDYYFFLHVTCPADYTRYFYLHNAWMQICVSNLTKAKVYFRVDKKNTGYQEAEKNRVLFDPSLFPANCRYFLSCLFYKNGASGDATVYLADIVGSDSRYLTGAVPDSQVRASSTASYTRSNVIADLWPPGTANSYVAMAQVVTNNWYMKDINVQCQFPGPSPIDRTATFEVPIEMTDSDLKDATTDQIYGNTKVALDTGDYDGVVTYYLEVVATCGSHIKYAQVGLVDNAGVSIITKDILRPGVQRVAFTPNAGLDYYRFKIFSTAAGGAFFFTARIIVSQLDTTLHPITKTRTYIPLLAGVVNIGKQADGYYIFQTSNTTFTTTDAATLYPKDDSILDTICTGTPYRFEVVNFTSVASRDCVAELYNNSDGADVVGTGLTVTGTIPTYGKVDFATLADGKIYQVRIKRVGASGYAQIASARLSIKLSPFKKGDVWWRISHCAPPITASINSLAYIDKRAYNGLMTYRHEASAVSNNTFGCTVDVWNQSSELVDPSASLTFAGTTLARKRSGGFDLPNAGYCYFGNLFTYTTAAQTQQQAFVVLYPVALSRVVSYHRSDFMPMFLEPGELAGFGIEPRKPLCT